MVELKVGQLVFGLVVSSVVQMVAEMVGTKVARLESKLVVRKAALTVEN
jgi:hypothetical protein